MISRYIVIVLAVGAAALQASRGAWVEFTGLAALALGLVMLRLAESRRPLRPLAWVSFLVTAVAMGVVFLRSRGA